jgi:hypothetical protein
MCLRKTLFLMPLHWHMTFNPSMICCSFVFNACSILVSVYTPLYHRAAPRHNGQGDLAKGKSLSFGVPLCVPDVTRGSQPGF